jgi:hypothetical protein
LEEKINKLFFIYLNINKILFDLAIILIHFF